MEANRKETVEDAKRKTRTKRQIQIQFHNQDNVSHPELPKFKPAESQKNTTKTERQQNTRTETTKPNRGETRASTKKAERNRPHRIRRLRA